MTVALLQLLNAVLLAAFAGMALGVARRLPLTDGGSQSTWWVTGAGFASLGASSLLQNVWAVAAVRAGAGTPIYETCVRWMPALNQSRTGAGMVLALILIWVSVRHREPTPRLRTAVAGALLVGLAAGLALGWAEGPMRLERHAVNVAVLYVIELIAFGVVLVVGAARGTLDAVLLLCLTLYALVIATTVPTISGMITWRADGSTWSSGYVLQLQRVVLCTAMTGLASFRLVRSRRGARARRSAAVGAVRPVVAFSPDREEAPEPRPRRRPPSARPDLSPGD